MDSCVLFPQDSYRWALEAKFAFYICLNFLVNKYCFKRVQEVVEIYYEKLDELNPQFIMCKLVSQRKEWSENTHPKYSSEEQM